MVAKYGIGEVLFWDIPLSLIFGPLFWFLIRKENATDTKETI